MKQLLLLIAFFIAGIFANISYGQQNYSFGYDNAGNRVSRTIVLPGLKNTSIPDSLQNQEYKDLIGGLEIIIYPNPTEGLLTVAIKNLNEEQPSSILVYDYNGMLLQRKDNLSMINNIDLSELPSATYILMIISGEQNAEWKVVKQ